MTKANELRADAESAGDRARQLKSLRTSAVERRREKALSQLAANEDWLEGTAGSQINDRRPESKL